MTGLSLRLIELGCVAALLGAVGCDDVPDVVVKVMSIPAQTTLLKAVTWQLRATPGGAATVKTGTPIASFAYTSDERDANKRSFEFGLQLPREEGVMYSISVAAFGTYSQGSCLISTTSPTLAGNDELLRGAVNLPHDISLSFAMEPMELLAANIDGLCLSNVDKETKPLISGVHLTLDQTRRMGATTAAQIALTGWNIQPTSTMTVALITDKNNPIPLPTSAFRFEIQSPDQISILNVPADQAMVLGGQPVRFIVKNPDGQESLAYDR